MGFWRKSKSSRSAGSSGGSPRTTHDDRKRQAEKNQQKYEDGIRKGYIDKAEWERIDREHED